MIFDIDFFEYLMYLVCEEISIYKCTSAEAASAAFAAASKERSNGEEALTFEEQNQSCPVEECMSCFDEVLFEGRSVLQIVPCGSVGCATQHMQSLRGELGSLRFELVGRSPSSANPGRAAWIHMAQHFQSMARDSREVSFFGGLWVARSVVVLCFWL